MDEQGIVTAVCYDLLAEIGKRSVKIQKKYGRDIAADCMKELAEAIAEYEKKFGKREEIADA